MNQVESEIDRYIGLLRTRSRRHGFTQLEIQQELGWGRSYISQLVTKQKSLRVEQVLLILKVIGVHPAEFFAELYGWPTDSGEVAEQAGQLRDLKGQVQGLTRLLLDKGLIRREELRAAVDASKESF